MDESSVCPLSTLAPGTVATVIALPSGQGAHHRLVNMGLNIGCLLRVIHNNRGGKGPVLVGIGGTRLAIGRNVAQRIQTAIDPHHCSETHRSSVSDPEKQ